MKYLFRGVRKFNKKVVYGFHIYSLETDIDTIKDVDCGAEYSVHNWSVSMFTGLQDKHNQQIFENDIVKFLENVYIVSFIDGAFCLVSHKKGEEICMYLYSGENEYEVIGNIFDNPDIIE